MHGSIWHISGDPDDLLPCYDTVLAELPEPDITLHHALRRVATVPDCPRTRNGPRQRATCAACEVAPAAGAVEPVNMTDDPIIATTNPAIVSIRNLCGVSHPM